MKNNKWLRFSREVMANICETNQLIMTIKFKITSKSQLKINEKFNLNNFEQLFVKMKKNINTKNN